jgi:hypothetical protein
MDKASTLTHTDFPSTSLAHYRPLYGPTPKENQLRISRKTTSSFGTRSNFASVVSFSLSRRSNLDFHEQQPISKLLTRRRFAASGLLEFYFVPQNFWTLVLNLPKLTATHNKPLFIKVSTLSTIPKGFWTVPPCQELTAARGTPVDSTAVAVAATGGSPSCARVASRPYAGSNRSILWWRYPAILVQPPQRDSLFSRPCSYSYRFHPARRLGQRYAVPLSSVRVWYSRHSSGRTGPPLSSPG